MATDKGRVCKDCLEEGVTTKRKAPHPGPRCATHNRAVRKARSEANHARHIGNVYGLTNTEYEAIKAEQGGVCAICQRATGESRRLSVDHDHNSLFTRGLLCRPCNTMLGHMRDDVEAFHRAIDYLMDPPAYRVIGERQVPFDDVN